MEGGSNYRFGPFELRTGARQLSKGGTKVKLSGQPYLILEVLLGRAGEIVTREELRQKLWPADTFVDFEHGLNTSVKKLRQALCDSAEAPRYIETAPRLGYRFIAAVEVLPEKKPQSLVEAEPAASLSPVVISDAPPRARLNRSVFALAFLVVVVLAVVWYMHSTGRMRSWRTPSNAGLPASPRKVISSIAVLPLDNLSSDPSQDYFTEGMTDELINDLAQLGGLRVTSRTSVMRYKVGTKTVPQIGQELGVDALIEGTVERVGNRVRIRVQLIDAATDRHLWARSYDHELKDVLLLQSTAAHDIATEIEGQVVSSPAQVRASNERTVQTDAYEAYLKGRFFWNKRSLQSLQQAVKYFQQAIALDPTYARAYAGLAESYAIMGYMVSPSDEQAQKGRAAARRAIELDDQLPEAHTALGFIAENHDWDWRTAEQEYRRAIQLNPNYATGHQLYAECLALQGRFGEAFPEIERARQLDPLSLIIATDNGAILFFSHQYDRAIEQFRSVLEMDPNFPRAHMVITAYVQKGLFDDALADAEGLHRREASSWSWGALAYIYGRSGQRAKAKFALQQLERVSRSQVVDPISFATAYIGIGDKEKALVWLQRAYQWHSSSLTALKVDPTYDPLRNDPRFQTLVRRIGL
jgi:TolB-like protein/DNA-binding winged helix-turn-helix (wHTH) protein/Tfp pilus assembly protein PilF